MFDANRLARNKQDLLEVKAKIQTFVSIDLDSFLSDPRSSLAVKYLLVEAVEAIADTCQHLLSKAKGIACEGYVDCILKAGEHGVIAASLANKLRRLADLRNSLIHRYWIINDAEIYALCRGHADDFEEFAEQADQFVKRL